MQNEGWGFNATFLGGPGDGLEDEVISSHEHPPSLWWIELKEDGSAEVEKLGGKVLNIFFKRMPKQGTKVAIYKIDKHSRETETVYYQYKETLPFREFNEKYR